MIHHVYDWRLVALSVAVAMLTSFAGLGIATRIREHTRWAKAACIVAAGICLGGGIWSMHFVAMLAFVLPIPVSYDPTLTLASLAVPIVTVGFGFWMLESRPVLTPEAVANGGAVMGFSIIVMHYLGMTAMQMPAVILWNEIYVALSVAIAVSASIVAILLTFRRVGFLFTVLGAISMGGAIATMHYTGMHAATFIPVPDGAYASIDHQTLAIMIGTVTLAILTIGLGWAISDGYLQRKT